ncbi:MAG: hypothetical protein ACYC6Z_10980 [Thermoleophilia bacterium]
MKYIFSSLLILIAFVPETVGSTEISSRDRCTGYWAAGAVSPYPDSGPSYLEPDFIPTNIPAPNGKFSIKATSGGLSLVGKNSSTHIEAYPPLMEVLWAPDSRNFVINVSNGGLVGHWDINFYSIDSDERPVYRDIQKKVRPIADKLLQCEPKQEANIGVVSWIKGGKDILIIAEVPPHSSCRNMGAIFGFRVSVKSGEIIERISENALRKKWTKALGCRFKKTR